jgi:hypothetical protein
MVQFQKCAWSALAALIALLLPACGGGSSTPPPPVITTTTLSVDIAAGTVSVVAAPTYYAISGTATDNGAGTATVNLDVVSNQTRLVFNLKALADNLSDGTASGDGLFTGLPYAYFGPTALAPGAMASSSFDVSGLTGTTFTMTVEFLDHPSLFVPGVQNGGPLLSVDTSGSGQNHPLDTRPLGFQPTGIRQGVHCGCVSADGRFLYLAPRNQPAIIAVDLTTFLPVMTADLSGGTIAFDGTGSMGFLDEVLLSPDGQYLYTTLTVGAHSYGSMGSDSSGYGGPARRELTTDIHVVKIDRATMTEVGRATLATGLSQVSGQSPVGKGLSLSPSGAVLAACIRNSGQVFVIESAGMTIYDADPLTGGDQGFDTTSIGDQPRRTVFRGENELFVGFSGSANVAGGDFDSTLLTIDIAARTLGTLSPAAAFSTYTWNNLGGMLMLPDGRLLVTHAYDSSFPTVAVYDFGTTSWTTTTGSPDAANPTGVALSPDGTRLLLFSNQGLTSLGGPSSVFMLDTTTLDSAPTEADGAVEIPTNVNTYAHTCIISPF